MEPFYHPWNEVTQWAFGLACLRCVQGLQIWEFLIFEIKGLGFRAQGFGLGFRVQA